MIWFLCVGFIITTVSVFIDVTVSAIGAYKGVTLYKDCKLFNFIHTYFTLVCVLQIVITFSLMGYIKYDL